MNTNQKTISVVYKNKHNLPINKQAVKEFFTDHESVAPTFSDKRPEYTVSRKHFKKATSAIRETEDSAAVAVNFIDYERICISIKRSKIEALPYKYRKLMGYIMHRTNCNRPVAMLIIKKMEDERFIKVHGDYVEYF